MHPILFKAGSFTVYSYGFFIALGAFIGLAYMGWQGKKTYRLSIDKTNSLFIFIVVAAVVGGKAFLFFENPSLYLSNPARFFSGRGFVFYGSFLFAVPTMLWFFKRNNIPTLGMLDIMAIVTCLVHGFGRIGCFMAGCCHGTPTDLFWGITFTSPICQAEPLNAPLYPTQLLESGFIFIVMIFLLFLKKQRSFDGQLFLLYLMLYAIGRSFLEFLRGDSGRGFVGDGLLSNSQVIVLLIIPIAGYYYAKFNRRSKLLKK